MTNAEARFNKSLRPRKPEGSLGRTAQDVHLDSHTAPELWLLLCTGRPSHSKLTEDSPVLRQHSVYYVMTVDDRGVIRTIT